MRKFLIIGFVFAAFFLSNQEVFGQFNNSTYSRNQLARNQSSFRSASSRVLSNPTTSPYLALTDLNGTGGDLSSNYFTSVRPRIEAQQNTQQASRQIQLMQRDVSAMRSAAAQRSQGGPRATGHPTRFGLYLQYYPGMR